MIEIDQTVRNLETLFQTLTGRAAPAADPDAPYAPIPPERNADQYVAEQIDRLMAVMASPRPALPFKWTPPVAIWESAAHVLIRVDLPGVPRDAVQVTLKHNILTIEGERNEASVASPGEYRLRRAEGILGPFVRRLVLPPGLAAEQLSAQMKDGVLEIVLPREVPVAAERTVPVQ